MTDVQVQDRVAAQDGQSPHPITSTAPVAPAPSYRAAPTTPWPHTWSGRSVIRLVELAAVVALAFLTLDFVFHAIGALNIGFAALTFTVGSFLASPFVGILKTTSATQGNLFIWADVLAMGAYAVAAVLVSAVVARLSGSAVRRAA
jgi:hypothetical protein